MAKIFFGSTEMSPAIKETIYLPKEKFGLTIDNFLGDVDSEGNLISPSLCDVVSFDGIKKIIVTSPPPLFYYLFAYKNQVVNIVFPDLEVIDGGEALHAAFRNNSVLKTASFQKLKTINGLNALKDSFRSCTSLELVSFDELEEIRAQQGFYYFLYGCTKLKQVLFPKLAKISGDYVFYYSFQYCTSLQRIDFPTLTEIEQNNAFGASSSNESFKGCTSLTEIHFRTDMQSVIENQLCYSSKFGATNATIYFDL